MFVTLQASRSHANKGVMRYTSSKIGQNSQKLHTLHFNGKTTTLLLLKAVFIWSLQFYLPLAILPDRSKAFTMEWQNGQDQMNTALMCVPVHMI